jgi:glycerol kinase
MNKKFVVALDQGTTSCRAILFDKNYRLLGICAKEFAQIYPQAGYVEHDAMEIYYTQLDVLDDLLQEHSVNAREIAAIGITNQRETAVVWDRQTGLPIYNAIVWQCRRTADLCEELKNSSYNAYIHESTGLLVDAYFSATKIKWILDNVQGARSKAKNGSLLFGTIDTWLLYKFTQGKVFATDHTNASRTMLYNIKTLQWDKNLLNVFDIPSSMMAEVKNSSDYFGEIRIDGVEVPITACCGDQQSSLFGQSCFSKGSAKNTYGTGCFLLANIGQNPCLSADSMVTTLAASIDNEITYAIEGSVFVGGAVIQWLRDELGLLSTSAESEKMAAKAENNGGVYIVPAFAGLGAPHWDMYARGTISGLSRGSNKYHIIRAALESIAYQTNDVLQAISDKFNLSIDALKVDGGACANDFLMQFQADISQLPIIRPDIIETTALGAACLAGLKTGFYSSKQDILTNSAVQKVFYPTGNKADIDRLLSGWQKAVEMTLYKSRIR